MKFWIVTPSYNQLEWLKLCIASIRDQVSDEALNVKDVEKSLNETPTSTCDGLNDLNGIVPVIVHHHVQDACSTDGTREFLAEHLANSQQLEASAPNAPGSGATDNFQMEIETNGNGSCPVPSAETSSPNAQRPAPSAYSFSFSSEKDEGMYDAINRGWKLAPDDVDVIAHLNCDEQYLTDALKTIANFMKSHAKADVVLADMVVVNSDGSYICHRRALKPHAFTSRFCCGGSTATTFQRALVTKTKSVFFDTTWRNFGDKVWYNALHKAGCRFAVCNQMVSLFAITGENLNWTDEGRREKKRYEQEFLLGTSMGTQLVVRYLGLWRVFKECKLAPPSSYSFYRQGETSRNTVPIDKPRGLWGKKWTK